MTFDKPLMTLKELKGMGFTPAFLDRAVHSEFRDEFVITSGKAKAKQTIDTEVFGQLLKKGAFKC